MPWGRFIKLKLLPIAEVRDVLIHAPEDDFISFFNSPYHSHRENTAVDIYVSSRDCDFAPSPVEGRVIKIFEFKPPESRHFPVNDGEELIILESRGRTPLYIRLLHTTPRIKVGDEVSVGDELGPHIRSGFFDFWTDPHVHVEVRSDGNLIRASGSLPMSPLLPENGVLDFRGNMFEGLEVFYVKEDYALLRARDASRIGGFRGFCCTMGSEAGILDGGIPHYSFGGVFLPHFNSVEVGSEVRLAETVIGKVERVHGKLAFFRGVPLLVYANDIKVKGLSLYLLLSNQKTVKIIPEKPKKLPLKIGEPVKISLQSME